MDWSTDDTEAFVLANRIRQVIHQRDPKGYNAFIDSKRNHVLTCQVENFELRLYHSGDACIFDEDGKCLLTVRTVKTSNRPEYSWNKDRLRAEVVPALDREMVLRDLSLLR
ncbi:MAG: hypothetical protein AB7L09_02350 [Nitrospira sp.]